MKEREIKKAAKKFIKKLKGKVDFVSIEEQLKTRGYKVVFFNTPAGDIEIERYNLWDDTKLTDAFTYKSSAKFIFINNNCSSEEKLYLLYHETGHVILEHIDYLRLTTRNRILLDIEADVFAYNIIHQTKINFTLVFLWIAVVLLLASHFVPIGAKDNVVPAVAPTESNTSASVVNEASETEYVFITPTGEKYHKSNCRYVNGKNCTQLTEAEAQKNYDPCSVCNP